MKTLLQFECNIDELANFSKNLAKKIQVGEIIFLKGDLGSGKTTFARFLINSIFEKHKLEKPKTIKSPSFPIMINYPLFSYQICHYDLYRLKNINEMIEIDFLEDFEKNISLIEWPDIILNNFEIINYYLIEFNFINLTNRNIKIKHSIKHKI